MARRRPPSVVEIAIFGLIVTRVLSRLPFGRLSSLLARVAGTADADPSYVDSVASRIERALARDVPVRHTCLTRSLTRYYFLRRAGADVRLVFGVGGVDGAYEGHSWVERDGEPYRESTDPYAHFVPMYTIPGDG